MSLARIATRAAAWTIGLSVSSRLVGVVGTLVLTRFLAPAEYGEVSVAVILVATVNEITAFGLLMYLPPHPHAGREMTFHVSFYTLVVGLLALGALLVVPLPFGAWFGAPGMGRFIPGMVVAAALQRVAAVPERMLLRDLRNARIGVSRALGELSYTGVALLLAAQGLGGQAIVIANIVRFAIYLVVASLGTGYREWLQPCRLSWTKTKRLLKFSTPMWVCALSNFAARRWDNLLVSAFLGARTVGLYNLAYNLADIPATHVGEHVGDVLLPSLARLGPEARRDVLARVTGLLGLVVFPLAVGLGVTAQTLTHALLNAEWAPLAPMLTVLAVLSVVRPIGWTTGSYLQATERTFVLMGLEIFKLGMLLAAIRVLAPFGALPACAAVGVAFGAHAVVGLFYLHRYERIPAGRMLGAIARPLLACVPMVAAVLGVRWLLQVLGLGGGLLGLGSEILAGGLSFVPAALWLAPEATHALVRLLRDALRHSERLSLPGEEPDPASIQHPTGAV